MSASGLQISDDLLRDVLREAAELEQTKGLIRPVTINLCGLVLGRFASGLPRAFRPSAIIRGFLRESITLPSIREISTRVIQQMITSHVTKRPCTIAELAERGGLDSRAVRGCLRVLGQNERSIVRPLDPDQQTWEIAHDFLVPLLDSITAHWRVSVWRRIRPWVPWIAVIMLAITTILAPISKKDLPKDPIAELIDMGWNTQKTSEGIYLAINSPVPKGSVKSLQRIHSKLLVRIDDIDPALSEWGQLDITNLYISEGSAHDLSPLKELKSLTLLKLTGNRQVRDIGVLNQLRNLKYLELQDTNINDLRSLADLKDLRTLNLNGTKVHDLQPLKELMELTALALTYTDVKTVEPLRALPKLELLDISETKVADLSPLSGMSTLTTLKLGPEVTDLAPLSGLCCLATLEIRRGEKTLDLSPLKGLRTLTLLELGYNHDRYKKASIDELRKANSALIIKD